MISQTAEYALRAITFLAASPGEPKTTKEIAEHTLVPSGYLSKILQSLGREGIVTSKRGLHGGFTLQGSPDEITLFDIINVIDPMARIKSCPLGRRGHGLKLCPLHRRLDDAMKTIEDAFRATTLAEVLVDRGKPTQPLCT